MEAEPWPPDPYGPEEGVREREPDTLAKGTSLAIAILGGAAVVVATGAVLATLFLAPVRAVLASPVAATLGAGLVLVTYLAGLGLLATGALLHHSIRARRLNALTYEGLVEETSQEFDKVSARLERVEDALARLDTRVRRRATHAEAASTRDGTSGVRSPGPEPVPVNVLPRVRSPDGKDNKDG